VNISFTLPPAKVQKVYCDIRVVDSGSFIVVVAAAAVCCNRLKESLSVLEALCVPPCPLTASFIKNQSFVFQNVTCI
jgi:hypothetical protein